MISLRSSPQDPTKPTTNISLSPKFKSPSPSKQKNHPSTLLYLPDSSPRIRLKTSIAHTSSVPQSPKNYLSELSGRVGKQTNNQPPSPTSHYRLLFSPVRNNKKLTGYQSERKPTEEPQSRPRYKIESYKTTSPQNEMKNSLLALFFPPLHSPISKPQQVLASSPDSKFKKFLTESKESMQYSCIIGPGNNSELIRRVMKKRHWWRELNENSSLYHFAWHQSGRKHNYDNLVKTPNKINRIVNHFEYHAEITTKSGLLRNLAAYCEQLNINVFDCIPITFMIDMDDKSLELDLQEFTKCFYRFMDPKDDSSHEINTFIQFLRSNLSSRSVLKVSPLKTTNFLKNYKMQDTFYRGANLWLLKPVDCNRGRGIELFNTLDGLKNLLLNGPSSNPLMNGPKFKRFVIQKYIESPLLVDHRKFDIRVWVLIDHELNLYFFKEGYLRLSSEVYSIKEEAKNDLFVHLTNNAVQKTSTKYGQYESGNQLSFSDFEKYLPTSNPKASLRKAIIPRMKELIKLSMCSVKSKLNMNDRRHCFEIFGYDFMIDSAYNTWLIEVNTNPCLEESSDLLKALLPRMIDDAFKLTVDKVFPLTPAMMKPEELTQRSEVYKVPGYDDKTNMWYPTIPTVLVS